MCRQRCRQLFVLAVIVVLAPTLLASTSSATAAEDEVSQTSKSKGSRKTPSSQSRPDMTAAKEAYEDALRAFNLGMWEEAVAGFQKSYRLSGDPALLFNVGQAQRQAGHVKEAIVAYKAFLREKPETPHRKMIETKIKDLESGIGGGMTSTGSPADPNAPSDQLTGIWEDPFETHKARSDESAPIVPHPAAPAVATPLTATSASAAPTEPGPMAQLVAPVRDEPSRPPVASAVAHSYPAPAAVPALSPAGDHEPATVPVPALNLRQQPSATSEASMPESGIRWWLWAGIGAAVAAGVVTAVLLSTRGTQRDGTCPSGLDVCVSVGK